MQDKKFSHALVAGIERYPLKVTKKMSSKRIQKRTSLKPFIKFVNYNHLLPTRYLVQSEIDLKGMVSEDKMSNPETKKAMKKEVRKYLQDK